MYGCSFVLKHAAPVLSSVPLIACVLMIAGPVPGIDSDLPDPERVANSFGDNNLTVTAFD